MKPILQKVRSKTNQDIYYTYANWPAKDIDGVTFLPVVRDVPGIKLQQTFYLRKDNLDYIK